MLARFHNDQPDFRAPAYVEHFQPLPGWLADRLLRSDEKVEWVRGPWFNPSWERYLTHPALVILPLTVGAVGIGLGRALVEDLTWVYVLFAILLFVVTIIVLGIANGYFTRLVITDSRLVILQGYEIVRSWRMDRLPPALLRYGRYGEESSRTINLDAVKTMLGNSSDKFTNAKTILSFGKQLDQITKRDEDRH
jgi:hypothetical protein